jgi:excinuclease ABC subunit C
LREALNLPATPHRTECYDISNIQGTSVVGSLVVFENGKPKNSEYRRFRIKTVEGQNDVGSMQEVLRRRFKRFLDGQDAATTEDDDTAGATLETAAGEAADELTNSADASADMAGDPWAQLPDLLIVDGGRPQLNAALEVVEELSIGVPVIGIAKENHGAIGTYEEIYRVGEQEPLVLPRGSQGLYLLQRIRDEAHRFAITYHRQVRSTRTFKSILDEIPGIGPKRKKALMRHFGSARAIAAASIEDLLAVKGMTRDSAERVKEHIGNGRAVALGE